MAIIKRPPKQLVSDVDLTNSEIQAYTNVEAIYARAEKLGVRTFPFDIISYLKYHRVRVMYEELDDMSGCVELEKSTIIVTINKYQNQTRQRFKLSKSLLISKAISSLLPVITRTSTRRFIDTKGTSTPISLHLGYLSLKMWSISRNFRIFSSIKILSISFNYIIIWPLIQR